MADTKQTFSVSSDFSNGVDPALLDMQVRESSLANLFKGIAVAGDDCEVWFSAELSAPNVVILGTIITAHNAQDAIRVLTEAELKDQVLPKNYVNDLEVTCTASGLTIDTEVGKLEITDQTVVTADPSLTKYVLLSLVYNETSDTFYIKAFEKTDGVYADLDADEYLVQQDIGEWYVVANGATLVEVT
ncbi:MAG: hypothetical protein JSW58_06295 [Candidatus Latescibacterota bacterium]|nr:MAG: hypothetical protein JSW58_06295 [Candidatus Latescibacterota bacterium]